MQVPIELEIKPEEAFACINDEKNGQHMLFIKFQTFYQVCCDWCGVAGPKAYSRSDAILLWNNLPRNHGYKCRFCINRHGRWVSLEHYDLPECDNYNDLFSFSVCSAQKWIRLAKADGKIETLSGTKYYYGMRMGTVKRIANERVLIRRSDIEGRLIAFQRPFGFGNATIPYISVPEKLLYVWVAAISPKRCPDTECKKKVRTIIMDNNQH